VRAKAPSAHFSQPQWRRRIILIDPTRLSRVWSKRRPGTGPVAIHLGLGEIADQGRVVAATVKLKPVD
jgi:hypothetical protein